MTYTEFEDRLLVAVVDAVDADPCNTIGHCEAMKAAKTVWPEVRRLWVIDAVEALARKGYFREIDRSGQLPVNITGEARRAADKLRPSLALASRLSSAA